MICSGITAALTQLITMLKPTNSSMPGHTHYHYTYKAIIYRTKTLLVLANQREWTRDTAVKCFQCMARFFPFSHSCTTTWLPGLESSSLTTMVMSFKGKTRKEEEKKERELFLFVRGKNAWSLIEHTKESS